VAPVLPPHAVPGAQAPVCDEFTPACAALHALSYVVPSHPHTSDSAVGQLVGFAVQTPSSLSEQSPVSFLQYWSLAHVFPKLPPHSSGVDVQAPLCDTLAPACAARHELSYVVPSHPQTRDIVVGHEDGIGRQRPSSSAEQEPVSRLQYSSESHVSPALPPHTVSVGEEHAPRVSPCLKCASAACSLMQSVCALWLDGLWQTHTIVFESCDSCELFESCECDLPALAVVVARTKTAKVNRLQFTKTLSLRCIGDPPE